MLPNLKQRPAAMCSNCGHSIYDHYILAGEVGSHCYNRGPACQCTCYQTHPMPKIVDLKELCVCGHRREEHQDAQFACQYGGCDIREVSTGCATFRPAAVLDLTKPLQTRDGRPVRVYSCKGNYLDSIHGAIFENCSWVSHDWNQSGNTHCGEISHHDLINVPPKRFRYERWANVFKTGAIYFYHSSEAAAAPEAGSPRIACVKVIIEGEEGEGL